MDLYFKINMPGEITEVTVWEAHKAYIRGILMMVGSKRKKRLIKEKKVLLKEIQELEQQHKISGEGEVLRLQRRREEMRVLIEHETRQMYNLVKKDRYINGNKPGKLLARALKKKKKRLIISKK